jgi:hypothetical protein
VKRAAWLLTAVLVVLGTRALAYAVEPSPLAVELRNQAGGPGLPAIAIVALTLGLAGAAAIVWLVSVGVEERRRLEPRPLAATPGPIRILPLAARAVALFAASSAAFALLESTIHWRAGLGWHGLDCLTGPVHRDALPIVAALSLLAVAAFAAAEHVLRWMRRTLARLAAVLPAPALPPFASLELAAPRALRRSPVGLPRGPPARVCSQT